MTHANEPLTPEGRRHLASAIVDAGWMIRRAAERFNRSPGGVEVGQALRLRRAAPRQVLTTVSSPHQLPRRTERRIIALRFTRRWGPHRIAYHLRLARSTVGRVLARYRMSLLKHLDRFTGLPVRKPKPICYEASQPGELVHVDIKKQGRISEGGGHRALGRAAGNRDPKTGAGYAFGHNAIDDHSRLAYSEILGDERKETAAGFWVRARAFFADARITVIGVMTDNGACYRSHAFRDALGKGVKHRRTRPYWPQTNAKVERPQPHRRGRMGIRTPLSQRIEPLRLGGAGAPLR
ncbi:transposase [Microbacterium paludicola]|uniref:Transposase n=1 Tax=Microbacterium paludicola TaxID=300019 RepID=A0A4Y9FPM0_9MICO|nr:transposase family protein [Microbacterium paludicola]TFU30473.1 transposase [Microbacterium paludicola]